MTRRRRWAPLCSMLWWQVHTGLAISSLYVFMQCFAVPGTITLSLLLRRLEMRLRGADRR